MKTKVAGALVGLFVSMPIWFYLLYQILKAINASELMFFLFWVYVPATILAAAVLKMLED